MRKKPLCSRSRLNIVLLHFFLCSFQQPEPLRQGHGSAAAFLISIADFGLSSKVLTVFFLPVAPRCGLRGLRFAAESPIIEPVLISYHTDVLILQEVLCFIWIILPKPLWTRKCCDASEKQSGATRAMPTPTIRQALPQKPL